MHYRVARSIEAFDRASWDAVAGKHLAMSYRWQRMMEASRRRYQPHYGLVTDQEGPLAIAVANAAEPFGFSGWRETLRRRTTLVLRGPFSPVDCGLLMRPGADPAATLPRLEAMLRRLCWQAKRPLLGVSGVSPADLPHWQVLGFAAADQPPNTVLDLPPTYDQYVSDLPKKGRSELGRMRRRIESQDVSFWVGPLAGESERLYGLLCEVFSYHGTPADEMEFSAELFTAMERELGDQVVLFKSLVRGELAGYLLCLTSEKTLWWLIAGLRYELARPSYAYFLLIDEMVRWAIEQGFERIHGGLTNERQKQRHGFQLQPRWFCYRCVSRPLNSLFARLLPALRRLTGRLDDGEAKQA